MDDPFASLVPANNPATRIKAAIPGATITSENRNAARNAAVGGVPNSAHLTGYAADFKLPKGMDPAVAQARLKRQGKFDQLIYEGDHVHYSDDPRSRGQVFGMHGGKPPPANPFADLIPDAPPAPAAPAAPKAAAPKAPAGDPFAALIPGSPSAAKPKGNLVDQAKRAGGELLDQVADVPREINREAKRSGAALKGDFTRPLNGKGKLGGIVGAGVMRAGKTALDAIDNATSPMTGAINSVIGRPVEKATGIDKRAVGAVASLALPFAGEAKLPGVAMKAGELMTRTFNPAAVSADSRAAAALHREVLGKRGIQADVETHKLIQHAKTTTNLTPEGKLAFLDYVENRSRGAKLGDPKLQGAADALRGVAQRYQKSIATVLGEDGPTFIKDYYAHMWKQDPAEVQAALRPTGRQGNSTNIRARKIPTYADGIKAGLTPRFDNPIDAMVAYNDNMAKFLGTHDIKDQMMRSGLASWHRPGEQPAGHVELQGVGISRAPKPGGARGGGARGPTADVFSDPGADPMEGRRTAKVELPKGEQTPRDQPVQQEKLYAPEDAARIYNNHLDPGFNGPAYRGARATLNGLTQLKLGLSAFHGSVMAREGIIGEAAKGIGQLSRGELSGAKTLAKAPGAFVFNAMRGGQMFKEIVGDREATGANKVVNDLYAKAGGRLGMDKIYSVRGVGSLYDGIKRGTFKSDLKAAVDRTYQGSMLENAKGVVDLAGNLIESAAAPIFKEYVPSMKRGAWASRMETYLKENPEATETEMAAFGRKTLDSIDNRFGELMVDNNFWRKSGYQMSQILLLSPSWDIGTIREIGGGIADLPKSAKGLVTGKGVTDKTAYVAALVAMTALENGVMTKLKTGTNPEGEDYFAYRTGGKNADGTPERAEVASYMKDVQTAMQGSPGKMLVGKMNPGVKAGYELATNSDWRGDPIYPTAGYKPQAGDRGLAEYAADLALPISVGSFSKGDKKGSNLGPIEKAMGTRPAPGFVQNPEKTKSQALDRTSRRWAKKRAGDAKAKAGRKTNDDPKGRISDDPFAALVPR